MPIFEYSCEKCGHEFDFLARTHADKPQKCPECGGEKLAKQLSSFAATVKESGGASCSLGSCSTPTCASGGCPFG